MGNVSTPQKESVLPVAIVKLKNSLKSKNLVSCTQENNFTNEILQSISHEMVIYCCETVEGPWNNCICHPPLTLGGGNLCMCAGE